ncbi:MAG: hypothetical protein ACWIPJ_08290 [Polaribacter sp.]
MKNITLAFALIFTVIISAQKKVEKLKKYKASNGVVYKIGDNITLNRGSNFNGSFNYVTIRRLGCINESRTK